MSIYPEVLTGLVKRVDTDHILDIYLPVAEAKKNILFIFPEKPEGLNSTKEIDITITEREDGRWLVEFVLLNEEHLWLFELLCEDLIESSRTMVNYEKDGAAFIAQRYKTWTAFFSKKSKHLSANQIRGLVGELLFLREHLIPLYGNASAVESWMGPANTKQDFYIGEKWFEVKTVKTGNSMVTINSLDQLSRRDYGELAVVYLNDTSSASESGITLNSLYQEICSLLQEEIAVNNKFRQKAFGAGYVEDPYYDDFVFEMISYETYKVIEGFPRITKEDVHEAVCEVKYGILLSLIQKFKNSDPGTS